MATKKLNRKHPPMTAGQRYGRLVAIKFAGFVDTGAPRHRNHWVFLCDCGMRKTIRVDGVRSGIVVSCGCNRDEKARVNGLRSRRHGKCLSREYGIWWTMLQRCRNPRSISYKKYGARGIKVCERWQTFDNFYADMGDRPTNRHSIDRINTYGDYEPGNCRWATPKEQAQNRRAPTRRMHE